MIVRRRSRLRKPDVRKRDRRRTKENGYGRGGRNLRRGRRPAEARPADLVPRPSRCGAGCRCSSLWSLWSAAAACLFVVRKEYSS